MGVRTTTRTHNLTGAVMTTMDSVAKYEIPRGKVNFAGLRSRTDIYSEIYERYCPVVDIQDIPQPKLAQLGWLDMLPKTGGGGVAHPSNRCSDAKDNDGICPHPAENAESVYVPDPDVLWVGRLIDGLTALGVFSSRKFAKSLINTMPAGAEGPISGLPGRLTGGGKVGVWFKPAEPRQEMIKAAATGLMDPWQRQRDMVLQGEAPTIALGDVIKDAEPGEIINSPRTLERGQESATEVDMWEAGLTEFEFNPRIRLDNRFGLHYLKRDDEIIIEGEGFPRPSSPRFREVWRLRPISEGTSHVQQDSQGDDVIQLGGMRA